MVITATSDFSGESEGNLTARLFIDFDKVFDFFGTSGTTFTRTLILRNGSTVDIEGDLAVFAASGPPDPDTGAPSSADVDVENTLRVFLDPLTPGVHIVDADGQDFPTSPSPSEVPEPWAALLACSGLILLVAVRAIARFRSA